MLKAQIYNGNKGTTSEYFTVLICEEDGELIRASGKSFKTFKGACKWAEKEGLEIIK